MKTFMALLFICYSSLTFASDTDGSCADCDNLLPSTKAITNLTSSLNQKKITSDLKVMELRKNLLHWECRPKTQELYLTDKSNKFSSDFKVNLDPIVFRNSKKCEDIRDELNTNQIVINDDTDQVTIHPMIVCLGSEEEYYLVNPDMELSAIKEKGKRLYPKSTQTRLDCTRVPTKFSSIGLARKILRLFKTYDAVSTNALIEKEQKKYLKRNFKNQ